MFVDKDADAWITWPDWPITHPDKADYLRSPKNRTIWRDVNVVLAPDADPEAKQFLAPAPCTSSITTARCSTQESSSLTIGA